VERSGSAELVEIGCGQGICSDRIDLTNRRYTGLDASPFMIARAKATYQSEVRQFVVGNAYELPFPERQFDAAFGIMIWHLLGDIERAALEMSRVLKPAGSFLIITANPAAYSEWIALYANPKIEGRRFEGDLQAEGQTVDRDVLYFHTLDEIVSSLGLAGFILSRIERFRKSRDGLGPEYLISIQGVLRSTTGSETNNVRSLPPARRLRSSRSGV
jgi:SAM-dependent methyltransferase